MAERWELGVEERESLNKLLDSKPVLAVHSREIRGLLTTAAMLLEVSILKAILFRCGAAIALVALATTSGRRCSGARLFVVARHLVHSTTTSTKRDQFHNFQATIVP